MRKTLLAAAITLAALPLAAPAQTAPADLTLVPFATGVGSPVAIRAPSDGSGRVFIVNQAGSIRVVKNGSLLATPFVTVPLACGGESGLLRPTLHPNIGTVGLPHNNQL